jgi:hypothetical protein
MCPTMSPRILGASLVQGQAEQGSILGASRQHPWCKLLLHSEEQNAALFCLWQCQSLLVTASRPWQCFKHGNCFNCFTAMATHALLCLGKTGSLRCRLRCLGLSISILKCSVHIHIDTQMLYPYPYG